MQIQIYVNTDLYEDDAAEPDTAKLLISVLDAVARRIRLGHTAGSISTEYMSVDFRWETQTLSEFEIIDDLGNPITKVGE